MLPSALSALLEQVFELASRVACGRRTMRSTGAKIFAEIRAVFLHDALRLGLAALIVVSGVVQHAVEAYVCGTIASGTALAEPDAFLEFEDSSALKASEFDSARHA